MKEIEQFIGEPATETWLEIRRYIEDTYGVEPEIKYGWAKYGWTVRYRKVGRSLCWLIPENGGFTVQIVLGKKESDVAFAKQDELSPRIQHFLRNSRQGHDGRWLYIRVTTTRETDDIKKLLKIKKKPETMQPC
jgi:hypothetical protein